MEPEFWHDRWKQSQTSFHQNKTNEFLEDFWPRMNMPHDAGIFVPMCGKTLDMIWLNEKGHRVVGVELSEIAAEQFCKENHLKGNCRTVASGELYQLGPRLSFICGDFFNVVKEDTGRIHGVYDRASLVALPPQMRRKYATHLISLIEPGAKILLITFEYNQSKMPGPPFSVTKNEIYDLYSDTCNIEEIFKQETVATMPKLIGEMLTERVEIITKKE